MRACALALIEHPQAHRSYVDGKHVYHAHANVGIAVALDDGLIVPVVREADTKSVRQIAREARDLAERARDGQAQAARDRGRHLHRVEPGHVRTSPTSRAIINPPESAILAVGATSSARWCVDGEIVVRQIMRVTLSCDHRACSGADGARLLQTIKRYLRRRRCCSPDRPAPPVQSDPMQLTDVMATQIVSVRPGHADRRRRPADDRGRHRRRVVLAPATTWSA